MADLALNELFDYILPLIYFLFILPLIIFVTSPDSHVLESTSYKLTTALSLLSDQEGASAVIPLKKEMNITLDNQRTLTYSIGQGPLESQLKKEEHIVASQLPELKTKDSQKTLVLEFSS